MFGMLANHLRGRALFIAAVAATTAWVIFSIVYLARLGWAAVIGLPIGDMASLMAAVGGPLAALWLAVAVIDQRRELRTVSGGATAIHLLLQDLAGHTAALGLRLNVIKPDAVDVCWARFSAGDFGAFARPFMDLAGQHPELGVRAAEAGARDPAVAADISHVVHSFHRLIAATANSSVREAFQLGVLGQLSRLLAPGQAHGPR